MFWSDFLGGSFRYYWEKIAMLARYHNANENSSLLIDILEPYNRKVDSSKELSINDHQRITFDYFVCSPDSNIESVWNVLSLWATKHWLNSLPLSFCFVFQFSSFDPDIKFNLVCVISAQQSLVFFLAKLKLVQWTNCLISNSKVFFLAKKNSFSWIVLCKNEFRREKDCWHCYEMA